MIQRKGNGQVEWSGVDCIRGQYEIVFIYALVLLAGACLNTQRLHILSAVRFYDCQCIFFMILFTVTTNFMQRTPTHLLSAVSSALFRLIFLFFILLSWVYVDEFVNKSGFANEGTQQQQRNNIADATFIRCFGKLLLGGSKIEMN